MNKQATLLISNQYKLKVNGKLFLPFLIKVPEKL